MGDTMLAALALKGEKLLQLAQVPIPVIGDDEVLVKIKSTALSHGVLEIWQRRPEMMRISPHVLGPQMAGHVHQVGKDVKDLKEGDRVFVWAILACGRCDLCQSNEEAECPAASLMGHAVFSEAGLPLYTKYHNGGLAEYVKAPAWNIEKLPENVSFAAGAFILQASVAFRALLRAGAKPGATVLLNYGSGMAGALATSLAPAFGVSKVIVASRTPESFRRLGEILPGRFQPLVLSELTPDWRDGDNLAQEVKAMNGGDPVDCIVDLSPVESPLTVKSLLALRRGGTMVLTGGNSNNLSLPYHQVMVNGYQIRGSKAGTRMIGRAIARLLQAGSLDLDALVTHNFKLEDANTVANYLTQRIDNPLMINIEV